MNDHDDSKMLIHAIRAIMKPISGYEYPRVNVYSTHDYNMCKITTKRGNADWNQNRLQRS